MKTKIKVTTNAYGYMGLFVGTVVEVEEVYTRDGNKITEVGFTLNGKYWALDHTQFEVVEECRSSYCECEEGKCSGGKVDMRANEAEKVKAKGPIKSDGGSSTYYDIELPSWLLHVINERAKDGKAFIKTEELIEAAFSNDFDAANAFKSLIRAWGAFNGGGKAGNTVDYECNKIAYSVNKLKFRHNRSKEDVQ